MKQTKPTSTAEAARAAAEHIGDPDFASKLEGLTPQQIESFVEMLRVASHKQKVMAYGYLAALIAILVGLAVAFAVYARREPGQFVGWVFLLPFFLAAAVLRVIGRYTDKMKLRFEPAPDTQQIVEQMKQAATDNDSTDKRA